MHNVVDVVRVCGWRSSVVNILMHVVIWIDKSNNSNKKNKKKTRRRTAPAPVLLLKLYKVANVHLTIKVLITFHFKSLHIRTYISYLISLHCPPPPSLPSPHTSYHMTFSYLASVHIIHTCTYHPVLLFIHVSILNTLFIPIYACQLKNILSFTFSHPLIL